MVKNLGSDSQYFWKNKLCRLEFFTSPKTSIKQAFFVKLSYMKLEKFKLSATSSIGNNIDHDFSCPNFIIRYEKSGM
jgi:hypothetical protein